MVIILFMGPLLASGISLLQMQKQLEEDDLETEIFIREVNQ